MGQIKAEDPQTEERRAAKNVAEELTLSCFLSVMGQPMRDYHKQQRERIMLVNRLSSGRKRVVGSEGIHPKINKPITSESYDLPLFIECSRTFF